MDPVIVQIGAHTITVEGDMLTSRVRGHTTPEESLAYFRLIEQVLAEHGRYFLLADMSQVETIPPETRRLTAEFARKHRAAGIAVWGSSFAIRTLFMLVMRAIRLLRGGGEGRPIVFVASEEEARAWVAAQRARLDGRQSAPPSKRTPRS